ncbi:uncharacterized protein [Solanum lycopersicum]|uniref:uncharacterized protein n=1 Tax=Solanum lycopersicum TaxID=4081 RepID=UPI003749EADF
MAPFEALYGKRYRSPIGWFDTFEVRPWGTDLMRESLEKVKFIQEKLLAAQSRQKEYADRKVRDLDFMEGEQVLLKVSPTKGVMRFGKRDREVLKLRSKEIASIKVQWKNRPIEDSTWESENDMLHERYPHLFSNSGVCSGLSRLNIHCLKSSISAARRSLQFE